MSLGDKLDEAFGIKKPKVVENAVARVEKIVIDRPEETKIEAVIDFNFGDLADTSDFKRLIYLAITGKTWRGTNVRLDSTLKELLEKIKNGL